MTYTVELPDYFGSIGVRWWCRGPEAWAPLTGQIMKLLKQMESDRFTYEDGPLAFSYSVELTWKSPGLEAKDLAGVRTLIPNLSNEPVAKLLCDLKGAMSLRVGSFNKNEAIIRCKMAEEFGLNAVMKRE